MGNIKDIEAEMEKMEAAAQNQIKELTSELDRLEKGALESKNMPNENPVLKSAGADNNEKNSDSLDAKIRKGYVEYKKAKEAASNSMNLEQRAREGLKHVADILGIRVTSNEQ